MLSLEKLREIDPSIAHLSDTELEEIRASLYDSAQLAWEVYVAKKYGSKYPVGLFPSTGKDAKI